VKWKALSPLAVGSLIAFIPQFLGRRFEYTHRARHAAVITPSTPS
jgi:hypothetical protein